MNEKTSLDGLLIVKCLSILLVVANHAQMASWLHGGLNGLILVSGISMAMFAFKATTKETLVAFWGFSKRLAIPSFILALIWAFAYWEFRWAELLFFQNWITKTRLVSFPIWYPQMMIQMLLGLGIIFWMFDLTPKMVSHPKIVSGCLLLFSLLICLISYAFWDTDYLHDKLPHLLAWNFVFGWLYWAFAIKEKKSLRNRVFLATSLFVISYLVFIYSHASFGSSRFMWLMIFGLIVIFVDEVKVNKVLGHMFRLIGQSTFFIFLWHYPAFGVTLRLGKMLGVSEIAERPIVLFITAVLYSIILWASVAALRRAYMVIKLRYILPDAYFLRAT